MPLYNPAPLPSMSKRILGNINNIYHKSWKHQFNSGFTADAYTFSTLAKAPCSEFSHVRVILKNADATPAVIGGLLFAVTGSNTDPVVPTTGNTKTENGATGWLTATFSGSNTVTLPAKGSDANDPSLLYSDWMPIRSIATTDSSAYPYIMARIKATGTTTYVTHGTASTDKTHYTYAQSRRFTGDGITTPSTMTTGFDNGTTLIHGFEFKGSSPTIKVLCVGDSITQGKGSSLYGQDVYSWVPIMAESLMTAGVPVNMINWAMSGSTTAQISLFGKRAISALLPSIVFYSAFSPNDISLDGDPTQASIDAQFSNACDFAYYAMSNNCLPVFTILAPTTSFTTTGDNFRKAMIARLKAAGFLVIDMRAAISDGATPERFLTSMNFDSLHPSDLGYTTMSPVGVNALIDLLRQNISW